MAEIDGNVEEVVEIKGDYGEFQLEELKRNWNSSEQIEAKLTLSRFIFILKYYFLNCNKNFA
jgi:hypothetical protein